MQIGEKALKHFPIISSLNVAQLQLNNSYSIPSFH